VAGIVELASIHAEERPGAVAMKVVGGDRLTYGGLERRSNRLARGLAALGIARGDGVAIACCDLHTPDLLVGYLAAAKLAAEVEVLALEEVARAQAHVVLACAEGVAACRAAGVRALIVGDGEGVVWWKALELRHSPAPITSAPAGGVLLAPAAFPVSLENGGLLHAVPLSNALGLHAVAMGALALGVPQILQAPFEPSTFARLLPAAPTACLLPQQVDELPVGSHWVFAPPGLCWRHPVTVDLDAEGGFGVGLAAAALTA
jgi:acyl-CoA synthetase (AMP-forming)/AMP-acid ligase II